MNVSATRIGPSGPRIRRSNEETAVMVTVPAIGFAAMWLLHLPAPLVFAVFLVVGLVVVVRRNPAEFARMAIADETNGPATCPRCTHAPRSPSGWCDGCVRELSSGAVTNETLNRFIAAVTADDWVAASAFVADHPRVTGPIGQQIRGSGLQQVRRFLRPNWLAKEQHHIFLSACGDPSDPTVCWASIRSVVTFRLSRTPLDVVTVSRYVVGKDGRIQDVTVYPGRRS